MSDSGLFTTDSIVFKRKRWRFLLLRVVIVASWYLAGFCILTFLYHAEMSGQKLVTTPDAVALSMSAAARTLPLALLVILFIETQIILLTTYRWSWLFCQLAIPIAWSIFGLFVGYSVYQEPDYGPKQTMFIVGGGLVFFLCSSFHLTIWRIDRRGMSSQVPFPLLWYVYVLLLSSAFLGSLRGWTTNDSIARAVLTYRSDRWNQLDDTPLLPPDDPRDFFP